MLLRVIHPNISSITQITDLTEEDVLDIIHNSPTAKVLIYTSLSDRWAFVDEEKMDLVFEGIIGMLESDDN